MPADLLCRARLVAIDLETSGSSPGRDRIMEIGIVEIEALQIVDSWSALIRPPLPAWSRAPDGLSGAPPEPPEVPRHFAEILPDVTPEAFLDAPTFSDVAPGLAARLSLADCVVCHNAPFDLRFLQLAVRRAGIEPCDRPVIDTLAAARAAWGRGENSLGEVAGRLGVKGSHRHRALPDALLTAGVVIQFAGHLGERYRLEEFPGYLANAAEYLNPPAGLPFRRPDAPEPCAAVEIQHRAVVITLLKSAARSAREVSLVLAEPGRRRQEGRFVPLRIDGERLVLRAAEAGGETILHLDDVHEVRW
jgi:DNA polymerase III epsilon subunit-like protein